MSGGTVGTASATLASAPPASQLDSTAPAFTLLKRALRKRRLVVQVACPAEPCTAVAAGRLLLPGLARAFDLAPASAQIGTGAQAALELRLSSKAWRLARRALRAKRRLRVLLRLVIRDAAGNAASARRVIRLRA